VTAGYILTTIVRLQHFQLTTGLLLHHVQPLLERGRHIRLVLNRVHPGVTVPAIRELHVVVGTTARPFLQRAFDVSVHEVQGTGGMYRLAWGPVHV